MRLKKLILAGAFSLLSASVSAQTDKPNILVIWGDDIGVHNVSAYNHGIMGYQTPNIDRLAQEGAMFTDAYAQQSCTAGRAAFAMGQHPFRTGMLTIGMPGSEHGIPDWTPTIADMLKDHGYMTAQHGKNHFGDRDHHLPTNHGFDQFFGNLYHLNAEEEPEGYYYPKDPAFRERFGPRGVLKTTADGQIEDTGPMTKKRMETADEEFMAASLEFIERAHEQGKPFFVWHNSTRMHVWTHLKPEAVGRTGIGLYPDGMAEHDDQIGTLLDKLDELGIADNTIVVYSTDNGAETVTWPDGGTTPFHGEKGTTWEGGFRVPLLVKWPGVIEPGTKYNDIISHEDWMPTLAAAVGEPELGEKLKMGHTMNGKEWRVHLDGHNFLPYFKGEAEKGPRDTIFYFDQPGNLNAVRVNDWKAHFAVLQGDITTAIRFEPSWPRLVNLRADPYEKAGLESKMYLEWYVPNMFTFVPVQARIKEFIASIPEYPFQKGSTLSAAGINYSLFEKQDALRRLQQLETIMPPNRQ
ncbi:arylsulfatase [Roseibium sp.]|uniref:arylsulfatase n=1 Tax=Roseibium sp. TaxID=1936156 RepID=UPI003BAB278F